MPRMSCRRTAAQSAVAAPATPLLPRRLLLLQFVASAAVDQFPFNMPHNTLLPLLLPAAVAAACLPQQLVACDFLRILTLHCQCNWHGDGDGDDGDDSATRRYHRLQQLLKCSYNFYADSQRAICSLSLPCSVSFPLPPLISLSRSFRIISQFSQFYCYYHEESDYYYYYYYYYAGFKNTHFGMYMHMHGI